MTCYVIMHNMIMKNEGEDAPACLVFENMGDPVELFDQNPAAFKEFRDPREAVALSMATFAGEVEGALAAESGERRLPGVVAADLVAGIVGRGERDTKARKLVWWASRVWIGLV